MTIAPYLFFDGNCEEAVRFYERSLGAKVEMLMRYKEGPPAMPGMHANFGEKVMHCSLRIQGQPAFLCADDCMGHPTFGGFRLTYTASDEPEAQRVFTALSEGGTVDAPLAKTFFSPAFGMLRDRFGVGWMVMVPAP